MKLRPFFLISTLAVVALGWLTSAEAISFKLSQVGYHTHGPKIAIIEDVPEGVTPKVVIFDPNYKDKLEIWNGRAVYKVKEPVLLPQTVMAAPGTRSFLVDFSDLVTAGKYEVRVEGGDDAKSELFEINDYVFWDLLKPVVKTFYFQRNAQELRDNRIGFHYFDCYSDEAIQVQSPKNRLETEWDAMGGWYDEGGFNKTVLNNSLAVARLMALYEQNTNAFQYFRLSYPLNMDGIGKMPDLLLEIKNPIDWLQAMQRDDGSFLGGVTGEARRCDLIDPSEAAEYRRVLPGTAKDTAASSAALAMAARVYKSKEMGASAKMLRLAERGWQSLSLQPANKEDTPYRLWAALELYRSTKNPLYLQYFEKNQKLLGWQPFEPENPSSLSVLGYLKLTDLKNPILLNEYKHKVIAEADRIVARLDQDPLQGGLLNFGAHSNFNISQQGSLLLAAFDLTQEEKYRSAASKAVMYLFGLNPLGKVYISGIGSNPVKNVFLQRFSEGSRDLPGYLVAGPNSIAQDSITPKGLDSMSFVDDPKATDVIHSHILYNASLAYVLSELNASYNLANPLAPKPPEDWSPATLIKRFNK